MMQRTAFLSLLEHPSPGTELRRLLAAGQGPQLIFLDKADSIPAGPLPWHDGPVLDHMVHCMDMVAGDALTVWMALAHDAGKLTTPRALWPHHYGHEVRGEVLVQQWSRELDMSPDWQDAGCFTARMHMRAGLYLQSRPSKRYDLLQELSSCPFADAFWNVVDVDAGRPVSRYAREDRERIASLPVDVLSQEQVRQDAIQLIRKELV